MIGYSGHTVNPAPDGMGFIHTAEKANDYRPADFTR